jgi:hypothetical protein
VLFRVPIPRQLPLKTQERDRKRRDYQQDERVDVCQHAHQRDGSEHVHDRSQELRGELDELSGCVLAGPRNEVALPGIFEEGNIQPGRVVQEVRVDPEIQLVVQAAPQVHLQLQAHRFNDGQGEGEPKPHTERTETDIWTAKRQNGGIHQPSYGESLSGGQRSENDHQRDQPYEYARAGGPD